MKAAANLERIAARQHGVITRDQALTAGMSASAIGRWSGSRWRRIHQGTYLIHRGEITWLARAQSAVLYAGSGAVLSHSAAAYLWGMTDREPPVIRVSIPASRVVVRPPGVRISRRRRPIDVVTKKLLPVTASVPTLVDALTVPGMSGDECAALIGRAVQVRATTASEVLIALVDCRARGVAQLRAIVREAAFGVESSLESRLRREVIALHGLPGFRMQTVTHTGPAAGRRDLENRDYGVILEGDGVAWHGPERFAADRGRDRAASADGKVTLRFTWGDVTDRACRSAVDIAMTLHSRGWTGRATPCGARCAVWGVSR